MTTILASLLLAATLTPVPAPVKSEFDDCIERAAGVDFDNSECIHAELDRQDKRLNAVYQKLLKVLDAKSQGELRTAQRAWVAYRDANTKFRYAASLGGTMDNMLALDSVLELTKARADELESVLVLTKGE